MCIKAGKDELESVKNLMSMSLNALIADSLDVDLDLVEPWARLVEDLGMQTVGAQRLREGIAEYFDGLEVEPSEIATVAELLERVVFSEFVGLPVDCSLPEAEPAKTDRAA